MMTLQFSKYHGTGNDFILIDDRDKTSLDALMVKKLCHRQYGIGGDGVVVLRPSMQGTLPCISLIRMDLKLRCAVMAWCLVNFLSI